MPNSVINKILVIDPVGCKAGMDYYDNNLIKGFESTGLIGYIASNYENRTYRAHYFFRSKDLKGKVAKLTDWIVGFWKSFRYAKKEKINWVIIHSFSSEWKDIYPYLLAKWFSVKVITIVHDIAGFGTDDHSFVRNCIYRYSTKLVVHNNYSKSVISNYLRPEYASKLFVIAHGHFLDLPKPTITKALARKQLGIPQEEKMILFFGQIKKQKGLDLLIHALAKVPQQVKLSIAGKPWKDSINGYQRIIETLSLQERVRLMIRYITDEERELLFKAADLIVIPYYEIYQSGVLLMSMSYGIPVLASDLPANREIIEDSENGLLFKSGNQEDLAKKLTCFFANFSEYKHISEKSLLILKQRHDWEVIAKEYEKIVFVN